MNIAISTIVALGLSIGLGVMHFFSERIDIPEGRIRWRVISLGAGISIGYLFIHLLPETYEHAEFLGHWVFVFLLAGFAMVHLAEKYAYKHAKSRMLVRELKVIHLVIFFIYYLMVGIAIKDKSTFGILEPVLFFVPVAIHTALSTSALSEMHGRVKESLALKIIMSLAPLLGAIFALVVNIPQTANSILTSLVAGVLLYVFVKEFLPSERKGEPFFFIIGICIYLAFHVIVVFFIR